MTLISKARRLAASAVAILAIAVAAPASAEPAMWVVRDADSTIYLFGTVHVLKPDVKWRSDKIAKALTESGDLTLEIEDPEDPSSMQALVMKYGLDPAHPLSAKLDPATRAELAAAAKTMGPAGQAMEMMRPWLAALTLSIVPLVKAGYDPESGVEKVLTREAKMGGKRLGALETAEQQIRFMADMTPEQELDMLKSTLDDVESGPAQIDAMVASWAAGDTAAMETAFIAEMRSDYDVLYEALIVRRNENWAAQIEQKLKGSGVSFIAVGAGHLVGPDSLQVQLKKRGIEARAF